MPKSTHAWSDDPTWLEFIRVFEHGLADQSYDTQLMVEQKARLLLKDMTDWKRPSNVEPSTWSQMRPMFMAAASADVGAARQDVLMFLPVTFRVMDNNVDFKIPGNVKRWKMQPVNDIIQASSETIALQLFPALVSHEYLEGATPQDIHRMLDAAKSNGSFQEWNHAAQVRAEAIGVTVYYMPMLATREGDLPEAWHYMDILGEIDDETQLYELSGALDAMWNLDRYAADVRLWLGQAGCYPDIVDEALTNRDTLHLEDTMQRLHQQMGTNDQGEEVSYQARLEVHLAWGPENAGDLKQDSVPSMRVVGVAQALNDNTIYSFDVPIHMQEDIGQDWLQVLHEVIKQAHDIGWYETRIVQKTSKDVLRAWGEASASYRQH